MNPFRMAIPMILLAAASAASAGEADQKTDSGDRRVCYVEPRTGSMIKQRVCTTEAERARRRAEDQEAARRLKHSSAGASSHNVDPKIGR